jgi:hypothetical protein
MSGLEAVFVVAMFVAWCAILVGLYTMPEDV